MNKTIFLKSILLTLILSTTVSIIWGQAGKVEGNLYSSSTKEKISPDAPHPKQ